MNAVPISNADGSSYGLENQKLSITIFEFNNSRMYLPLYYVNSFDMTIIEIHTVIL